MGVLNSSYIKALGVKSAGLKKMFFRTPCLIWYCYWLLLFILRWSCFNIIFLHLPLIEILAQGQKARFSYLQLCWTLQGRVLIQQSFYLPFLNFAGWLVVQSLLLLCSSHCHVCRTGIVYRWKFTIPCLAKWSY